MDTSAVDQFISTYNDYLRAKEAIFGKVRLIERIDVIPGPNLISYFLDSFRFPPEFNYSGFVFGKGGEGIKTHLVHFATHLDYNLYYAYNTRNEGVCLWDFERNAVEWECAENPNLFFLAMVEVMKTKLMMIQTKNFELDTTYLKGVYERCMTMNGSKRAYRKFYQHILGL